MSSLHGVNRAFKLTVSTAACAALAILAAGCGEKQEPATTGPVVTQSTNATTTTTTTIANLAVEASRRGDRQVSS